MADFLGLNQTQFYTLVLLLLLIILGIVSFHYYTYVQGKNGLSAGMGFGVQVLPNANKENYQ